MKKVSTAEVLLSAAIVRDVTDRHANTDVIVTTKPLICGYCIEAIPTGHHAIMVQTFHRKKNVNVPICKKHCCDAHETAEMEFFGCKELENIPEFQPNAKKMSKKDLKKGFVERLLVNMQNDIDRRAIFHKSYQIVTEDY